MTTRILIVDDEQAARDVLRHLVQSILGTEVSITEADGVETAVAELQANEFDFLFLDIHLKRGNGFDILRRISHHNFHLVFTTAYDQYAIQAFQYSAVDYLLKPIARQTLEDSFKRTAARLTSSTLQVSLLEELMQSRSLQKILLPTHRGEEVFQLENLTRVQANGNYSVFHFTDGRTVTSSKTLKIYEEMLSESGFIRVHQSHLVNASMIKKVMRTLPKKIALSDGTTLPVSRRLFPKLLEAIKS